MPGPEPMTNPDPSRRTPVAGRETALPGDLAMWFFILAELTVFAALFLAFAWARLWHAAEFAAGQVLVDRGAGAINTVLLITSSAFVVQAVHGIGAGDRRACGHWLAAAIATGCGFVVFKSIGFAQAFAAGVSLDGGVFPMFYLLLTGFHFLHVLLGLVILAAVWVKNRRGAYTAAAHTGVETGASYWHMVDLVWIVLFPLVYVLR